jgi:O-antigen biosynthesis protein
VTDLPLISCVCVTRERSFWLDRAVRLWAAQTYPNKELIIIDSSHRRLEWKFPARVRYVPLDMHITLDHSYQLGYEIAKGSLIAVWDDDDYHGPNRLQAQADPILNEKTDFTGIEPPIFFLQELKWRSWKPETIARWHKEGGAWLPFHDGSALGPIEYFRAQPLMLNVKLYERAFKAGARFLAVPNDGHFVYVRHKKVMWHFDPESMCNEAQKPDWISDEMMAWWMKAKHQEDQEPLRPPDHINNFHHV